MTCPKARHGEVANKDVYPELLLQGFMASTTNSTAICVLGKLRDDALHLRQDKVSGVAEIDNLVE